MPTLTHKVDSREWTTGERPSETMHYVLDGGLHGLPLIAAVKGLLGPAAARADARPSGRRGASRVPPPDATWAHGLQAARATR